MSIHTITLLLNLLLIVGGVLTLYGLYFCVIALFGFKKQKLAPDAEPTSRFAVVIAARNEEAVIGQLVDSLNRQNYPKELYDVYVAPNNCTDDTRGAALAHGAKIFTPQGTIRSKGDVLKQAVDALLADGRYDAMCVFDADNLVHPDFLQRMNNAIAAGARVAQGFRDSKNPTDTAVSTCYSVCYWMVNRFYNAGRRALGLSALINGSGFMVKTDVLEELGGWNTETMTEDYEFTAQCVLRGIKVQYVQSAVIYDEQPLTFFQSWKQRRRWCTGSVQGMQRYWGELVNAAVERRSWACMDLAFTFMTPAVQAISLLLGAASLLLGAYRIFELHLMPLTQVVVLVAVVLGGAFIVCSLLATFVIRLNRGGGLRGMGKGIGFFALFLLSWVPISIISLFNQKTTWEAIGHSRTLSIGELEEER